MGPRFDDLEFLISADLDREGMEKMLVEIGLKTDQISKRITAAMSFSGALQADKQRIDKIFEGMGRWSVGLGDESRKDIEEEAGELLRVQDAYKVATKEINYELGQQLAQIVKIQAAMHPALLADRVRLNIQLAKTQEEYVKALEEENIKQGNIKEAIDAEVVAQEKLNKALNKQWEQLVAIKVATRPDNLKKQVEMDIEVARATQWQKGKYEAERERQAPSVLEVLPSKWEQFKKNLFGGENGKSSPLLGAILGKADGGGTMGAIGGAIGGATPLGPIGAIIGSAVGGMVGSIVSAIPKIVGGIIAAPAAIASAGLGLVSRSLAELGGVLGPVGAGFEILTTGLGGIAGIINSIPIVGSILGPLSSVLAGIPGILKDITTSLVQFAAKASPGQFRMWTMALEDVQGIIGQTFLPILELMRDGVRLFGDVLANILPSFSEMREVMAPLREAFRDFTSIVKEFLLISGPDIRNELLNTANYIVKWLSVLLRKIGDMFDPGTFKEGDDDQLRSSVGAASRAVWMGGMEEYAKQLQMAAYAEPGGVTQIGLLQEILSAIDTEGIEESIDDFFGFMETALSNIGEAVEFCASAARAYIAAAGIPKQVGAAVADFFGVELAKEEVVGNKWWQGRRRDRGGGEF